MSKKITKTVVKGVSGKGSVADKSKSAAIPKTAKASRRKGKAFSSGGKVSRTMYAYGGKVQMDGSQPKYKDDMPKCMPN